MVKITVGNSECKVEGLNVKQLSELRTIMSYQADPQSAWHSGSPRSLTRHLMDKRGNFPTGLLYLFEGWAAKNKLKPTISTSRVRPMPRSGFPLGQFEHTPYKEQKLAAEICEGMDRGIVVAPTGLGKSAIVAMIIHRISVPTLVVVPNLELKKQLTETLSSCFGSKHVGDSSNQPLICVENVAALDPKEVLAGYDCVIIDEFHHSGAKTYRELNKKAWKNVFYKFGLTATPFRSQDRERFLLESVLSQVIYRVEYKDAVAKGYIAPVEAYYIEVPKTSIQGNELSWPSMYSELVVNNIPRNDIVADLITQLEKAGKSTLCLVKEVAHGQTLANLTGVGFSHGEDEHNRERLLEFNLGERTSLIGTTGVLGEGVDTRPAEYIVIAGLGKSPNSIMQQIGRGLRKYKGKESCKVILFKDTSHKWTLNHFKEQCKIIAREYGIKPVKVTYDNS